MILNLSKTFLIEFDKSKFYEGLLVIKVNLKYLKRRFILKILLDLKSAVRDFYDKENKETLRVSVTGRELDAKRHYILSSLFDLLFNTSYINDETKLCLLNYHLRLCDVQDEIYRTKGTKTAYSTSVNKVYKGLKKIEKNLGKDIIVDVIDFTTKDIDIYYERVNAELSKMKADRFLNIYDFDIDSIVPSCNEVSLDRLKTVCDELRPFLKENKESLYAKIDKDAIAYMKYLYSLDRKVDYRKGMIESIIRGDYERDSIEE